MNASNRLVQIRVDQYGQGTLIVDGKDLSHLVTDLTISTAVGELSTLYVTLNAVDVDFEGPAEITTVRPA